MTESFELPVIYKSETLLLPAELRSRGYSHQVIVQVAGQPVLFEPDEERNYRAVAESPESHIDTSLLACVAAALEAAFK